MPARESELQDSYGPVGKCTANSPMVQGPDESSKRSTQVVEVAERLQTASCSVV